jgi:hypothetical protein
MTRRSLVLGVVMALVLAAVPVIAHDDYRVVGTITKVQAKTLDVKTKEGKTFTMAMDAATLVTRDKKKVSATELQTGASVVVDARGDSESDLVAVEVRIVPKAR